MGKKGIPHRKWSKEEKLYYIHLHLDEHLSVMEIERRHGVRNSLVSAWVKRYLEEGEDALEPKNGNPYAALHTSKTLSEVDRLRLIIAKQEVEIARLKKGYVVELQIRESEMVSPLSFLSTLFPVCRVTSTAYIRSLWKENRLAVSSLPLQ